MGSLTQQQLEIINYGINVLKPKPILTGSQWADKYFYLSAESSSVPGKWKTRPWQVEIINAMTDQITPIVVFKKPTRVGYTKMLGIASGFYIHQHPSVQLHYQPNADEAKGFAEDEFEPMVRDNPDIARLIETPNTRGRTKKEKTVKKLYPGGYAEFLGAESDRNFNRRTARVVSGDEIDTWKKEAGNAGDTVTTMMRRTSDFWDRKNILGGKPVGGAYNPEEKDQITDGVSVVDYWFVKGTQEHRHLPCPHCDTMQKFDFEDMLWDKDKDENGKTIKHYPETAHFRCIECDGKIFDKHKRAMDKKGKWVADNPDAFKNGIRSFHIWAMLSYSPNVTWGDIVKEFLDAKNNKLKFKAFTNEVLARTWEEDFEKIDINVDGRLERYEAEVPYGVLVLTLGTDIQRDRIECELVGWGENEESWSICYKIFTGDTSKPDVWERFDEFTKRHFIHENGGKMRIYAGGIDTGYRSTQAYDFCRPRFNRRLFALKGSKTIDAPIAPTRFSTKNKGKVPLFNVGVNEGKNVIASHIATQDFGPGFMHFPEAKEYDEEYFKQLTGEKRGKDGRWVKIRARNEAFDVRNYAYIAMQIANVDLELLAKREQCLGMVHENKTKRKRKTSGWMSKKYQTEK